MYKDTGMYIIESYICMYLWWGGRDKYTFVTVLGGIGGGSRNGEIGGGEKRLESGFHGFSESFGTSLWHRGSLEGTEVCFEGFWWGARHASRGTRHVILVGVASPYICTYIVYISHLPNRTQLLQILVLLPWYQPSIKPEKFPTILHSQSCHHLQHP